MFRTLGAIALASLATPAFATTISDPAGDFLASYTGPQTANLDIISASASIEGSNLLLSATANGPIGGAGSLYIFGVNRGGGTARLAGIGGTVLFDAAAILFPDGTGRIALLSNSGPPAITTLPGIVTVSGATISAQFALNLLPSTGFDVTSYTFGLWSRQRVNPAADGLPSEIADFAPNSGSIFASVPEPASWALMILGFGATGAALRRRPMPKLAMARA